MVNVMVIKLSYGKKDIELCFLFINIDINFIVNSIKILLLKL